MSTPADVVRQILLDAAIGSVNGAWPIFVSFLPQTPDSAICVYDTAGRLDGRLMTTGKVIEHPGIQVLVRGLDYPATWTKIDDLVLLLDGISNSSVALASDEVYSVQNISRTGAVIPVGVDETDGRRRNLFTANYIMTLSRNQ